MDARLQKIIDDRIREIIDKASNASILSNILLDTEQLELLHRLNVFCVSQVLDDIETLKDPRKIIYKPHCLRVKEASAKASENHK